MSLTQELAPPQVRWDLSALFNSIDDPRIEETWTKAHELADQFDAKYRGKIDSPDLTAQTLASAITELEDLIQQAGKPVNYSHLLFACNTGDPQLGAFLQKQMEKS